MASREIVQAGVSARIALFPSNRAGDPPEYSIVHFRPGGAVKSINTVIMLQAPKHVADVDGKWNKEAKQYEPIRMITGAGWDKLNAAVGVSVYMPETIIGDDGRPAPNPSCTRIDGVLKSVRIKAIGIGRTRIGNIAARPYVIDLDLDDIFRRDLARRWGIKPTDKKPEPEQWGHLRPHSDKPASDPKFVVYPLPGGIDLVVDINAPAVRDVVAQHLQRVQFATRIATTICRRKILELFCPIPEPLEPVDGKPGTFAIPVVAWQDADRDMLSIGQWVEDAKSGDSFMVDGEKLDVAMVAADGADPGDVEAVIGDDEPLDADVHDYTVSGGVTGGGGTLGRGGEQSQTGRTLAGELSKLRESVISEYAKRAEQSGSNALWLLQASSGFNDLDAACESTDFQNLRAALEALNTGKVGDADVADRSDGNE